MILSTILLFEKGEEKGKLLFVVKEESFSYGLLFWFLGDHKKASLQFFR